MEAFATVMILATAAVQDPSQEEPAITVTLKDGIHFRSADGNLDGTLSGYVVVNYRFTAHRPKDDVRSLPDSWILRQVRPDLSGVVYRDFDFRFVMDFAGGTQISPTSDPPTGKIADAYFGWRRYPELSIRLGQFKVPFGQEQTSPDRFGEFAERSLGNAFVPGRDIGAMAYGRLFDGLFGYEIGFFNGSGVGVVDNNHGKEFAGRIRIQPFAAQPEDALLHQLRFGLAGTAGTLQNVSSDVLDGQSGYLGILYLDATTGTLDGPRKRAGAEFTWNYGPFGLRGEWWRRVDGIDAGSFDNERLEITAWNAWASYVLTGEKKPVEARLFPDFPYDPRTGGWGAVEAAFRVDRLKIGNSVFTTGVGAAAGSSNVVTGYTFGMNWYVTRYLRVSPNVFWEVYDDPILFSTGRTDRHFFGGMVRFQLEF